MKSSANGFALRDCAERRLDQLINGTREFFGNKLAKAVEVVQIGQLIQRKLVLSDLTRTIAWLISDAISFLTAETISKRRWHCYA